MRAPRPLDRKPTLHHVTFKTTRLHAMVEWYNAVVGCEPIFQADIAAWTTNDTANHRIAFLATPGIKDDPEKVAHSGVHHTAFEFGTLNELLDNYERLSEVGIEPHMCLDHGLTTSLYYLDPDGNSVELQSDNFGNWIHSSHFMRTSPDFARNPIGVEFDPRKLIKALNDGAPLSDVLMKTRAGDFPPEKRGDIRLPG